MDKALDIIQETSLGLGIKLNIHKIDIFCLRLLVVNFVESCFLLTLGGRCQR